MGRRKRITDRIVETTAKAVETFVPVDSGPDPRLHRHEVNHAVHVQHEAAGGAFEESFDYEDPYSERHLPAEYDGRIVMRPTPEEEAGKAAYAKALADPASVLTERVVAEGQDRTMAEAGHALAKREITEHHAKDPDRMERLRRGLLGADPEEG